MSRKGSGAFGIIFIVFCAVFALVIIVKYDIFDLDDDDAKPEKPYVSDKILLLDYAESDLQEHIAYYRDPRSGICFVLHGVQFKGRIPPYAVDVSAVPCTKKVKAEIERQKYLRNPSARRTPDVRETITIEIAPDAPPPKKKRVTGSGVHEAGPDPLSPGSMTPIIITEPVPKDAASE